MPKAHTRARFGFTVVLTFWLLHSYLWLNKFYTTTHLVVYIIVCVLDTFISLLKTRCIDHIHHIRVFELMFDISRDTSLLTIYRDIETTTFMTRLQLILSSKIRFKLVFIR